ncbi:hypothetical protein, partial [Roseibium sediminis]|uniref:hypothetical protein n=1 Tax=Roseibium sediminis TaxID=1775174 RepID=UPI00195872FD
KDLKHKENPCKNGAVHKWQCPVMVYLMPLGGGHPPHQFNLVAETSCVQSLNVLEALVVSKAMTVGGSYLTGSAVAFYCSLRKEWGEANTGSLMNACEDMTCLRAAGFKNVPAMQDFWQ